MRAYVLGSLAAVATFRGNVYQFVLSGSTWSPAAAYPLGYQFMNAGGGGYAFLDPSNNFIYTFSSAGFMTRIEDRNGNALTITQGSSGPTQVSDGLGRTLTFTYNSTGKLI